MDAGVICFAGRLKVVLGIGAVSFFVLLRYVCGGWGVVDLPIPGVIGGAPGPILVENPIPMLTRPMCGGGSGGCGPCPYKGGAIALIKCDCDTDGGRFIPPRPGLSVERNTPDIEVAGDRNPPGDAIGSL